MKIKERILKILPQNSAEIAQKVKQIMPENLENNEKIKAIFSNLQSQVKLAKESQWWLKLDQVKLDSIEKVFKQFLNKVKPEDIKEIESKLVNMQKKAVSTVWDKIQLLQKMMQDNEVSWQSKALAIATLLYLVSPIDAIPDIIPFAGFTDDIALIIAVVASFGKALDKYMLKQAENPPEIQGQKIDKIGEIPLIDKMIKGVSNVGENLENYVLSKAEKAADIEVKKYNQIVRITLIGSIITAVLTIAVKLILKQIN
ncbi:MAG TPA: YkvA family protein [Allocoleopsis sp.]